MQRKSINILLVMSFFTILGSMSGCKHLDFNDPLTWRMSLNGGHDIVGNKYEKGGRKHNVDRVSLGVILEPDTTKIRIREEEKSYYRRKLWELQQAQQLQKDISTNQKIPKG